VEKFNFVEKRASLQLADGSYKFDKMIMAPDFWSERAVTIAADKYLFGDMENSIAELVLRVASHIAEMNRYNIGNDDELYWDLTYMLLNQRAAFNSPVWFNVGVGPKLGVKGSAHNFYWDREIGEILPCHDTYQRPQGAACFIQSVDDTMESIMRLATSEAMLFKYGSGTGTDLSTIRSSRERLSNGGIPSGPLSFMRIYDQIAMVVKSGGKTRRAAKMQSLKNSHPDIIEFIECKWREELKAKALVAAGYSSGLDGEAIQSAFYQNSNISVRVSDEFMRAVEMHETYDTIAVTTGEPIDKLNASKVLMQIAEATWKCGDPGLQFDDTINYWHTCKNSGRINASNPCCFTGDTLVKTSKGDMTFEELMSTWDLPYAFAWDFETNMPVLRKIKKVWRSGDSERLVKVTTDRGITVECTPEHRFYLRDGSSVEAQDLKSGMALVGICELPRRLDGTLGFRNGFTHVNVESVSFVEKCVPVYDMEVEDVHNFTVTSPGNLHGIVVHNSEYMFLDDSACNLASLNLIKYLDDNDNFKVLDFARDIRTLIRSMDALVDGCSYPTAKIAENSHRFRPLGLGYCNLGGLLMAIGVPYDSDAGRAIASEITSYMTAVAYHESALLARDAGAFEGFDSNREPMLDVIKAHMKYSKELASGRYLIDAATIEETWDIALSAGDNCGYRNAQVTVLAPTGTISLFMDAETGGIEPFLGLISYKKLVGGGTLTKASQLVERGLRRLGYDGEHLDKILEYIKNHNNVLTDLVKHEHQNVFETSFGAQALPWRAHIDMMAAVQPFLSGAISKCVTGDTVITTDRGLVRIGDLYRGETEDSFSPIDLAVDSGKRTIHASEFYFGGVRDVFEVATSDGRKIRGTAPHRLMVATNEGLTWKRITEIEDGDYIAIKLGSEMWGNKTNVELSSISPLYGSQKAIQLPSEIDEDLALLLGMITADGSIVRSTYTVSICKNEVSVLDTFDRIMLDKFGLVSRRAPASTDRGSASLVSSKSLCEWFDAIGFSKDYIPDVIMQGPRRHAIAYLSGLYLDGYIGQSVSICQKRRTLLDDVQRIWDNLGVHTYFTDNFVNGLNYPVLHVHSHHRKYAADLIDWLEAHKQKRAYELENGQDRRVFPMYREYIKNVIREKGATQEFRSVMDGRTQNITMPTAASAVGKLGININPEVFDYEYVLAVSVNHVGQEAVYDLSIPEDHSFVANGIVNHNTVNMPNDATADDIYNAYHYAWRSGLKSIAIYRDGSKATQPESSKKDDHVVDTSKKIESDHIPDAKKMVEPQPMTEEMLEKMAMDFDSFDLQVFDTLRELVSTSGRTRLPDTRNSVTHKFDIAGHEGYLTVGLYKNGQPGELFITISKEGSTIAGLLGVVGTLFSMAVQSGVPLSRICDKFIYSKFEPSGWTNNPEIGYAHSIVDYIFRWLKMRFVDAPIETEKDPMPNKETVKIKIKNSEIVTGEPCKNCGGTTVPSGACWVCTQCGETTGCG
jgi:ribonucleotide reductase alpha subunit